MSYNARSWSNPINLDANNLNRLEQGIKNSHDTLEILNEEVSNLQLRYKNTASKINLLVKDSPNILETLNSIQSTIKNNDVNSILSSMDSFLMKSKQSLTDNELIQIYSNLKLNTFLRLDSIKVNGENVVEGSTVNIKLPKVDEHLDINSNNAISNRAVAEALDKLKTLKPSGSNTNTNTNTNISGLADWALQPNKPQYYFSEILGKPDLITKTEAHKYTDDIFSALVNGAPETLDTLKEISDWIATDEYGTTALINRVSSIEQNYLPLTGGTLTGAINLNGSFPQIKGAGTNVCISTNGAWNGTGGEFVFEANGLRPSANKKNKMHLYDWQNGTFGGTVKAAAFDGNATTASTLKPIYVGQQNSSSGSVGWYKFLTVTKTNNHADIVFVLNISNTYDSPKMGNGIANIHCRWNTEDEISSGQIYWSYRSGLHEDIIIGVKNGKSIDFYIYIQSGNYMAYAITPLVITPRGTKNFTSYEFYNTPDIAPITTKPTAFITSEDNSMVKQATQDSDGNVIKDTYLKLSGGTITGSLTTNNGVKIPKGQGVKLDSINNVEYMLYGDGASTNLFTQIRKTDGSYGYAKLLDIDGNLYSNNKLVAVKEDLNKYLPLTGGTLTGDLNLEKTKYVRVGGSAVLGHNGTGVNLGNPDLPTYLRGKQTNPTYNGTNLALITDNVASATKATQDGSGNVITSKYTTLDTTQTISGQKTFSKAPYFTAHINRYSKSSVADITKTATNTTWHYQYEDYLDTNGKRLGVIGSVQTGDGYYGVYLQGGNQSSLNVLTDGTNGRITTNNILHLSRTTDASNDYTKEPALVIGSKTASRLHVDNNEIQAFNGAATADKPYPVTWLGLNKQGGDIGFATNSGGGMNFQPKIGLIPSVTNQLNLGNSTYGWKDIHLKGALYFD